MNKEACLQLPDVVMLIKDYCWADKGENRQNFGICLKKCRFRYSDRATKLRPFWSVEACLVSAAIPKRVRAQFRPCSQATAETRS